MTQDGSFAPASAEWTSAQARPHKTSAQASPWNTLEAGGTDLRHQVVLGPVGAELLREFLQVERRGLPDAENLVLQPRQALLPQLLLQGIGRRQGVQKRKEKGLKRKRTGS